jgi:hypothetical protein
MQYYNEEKMHTIRERVDKEVLSWPHVTTKKMYGCPCYKYKDKLFAFLVTNGVVLVKVNEQDMTSLAETFLITPFSTGTRTMGKWPQIPLDETSDLNKIFLFIKQSYRRAQND